MHAGSYPIITFFLLFIEEMLGFKRLQVRIGETTWLELLRRGPAGPRKGVLGAVDDEDLKEGYIVAKGKGDNS